METFKIGTMLYSNGGGAGKCGGISPLALFTTILSLPFEGVTFAQGIVGTPTKLPFKKDAAYDFLKSPKHNWRKFMLALVHLVVHCTDILMSKEREKVLIF